MAATANYNPANFADSPSRNTPATRSGGKRKREPIDASPNVRGAPTARRGNATVEDSNNAFIAGQHAGDEANAFDFSNLGSNQQSAAAALSHYSMTVPGPPAANFINQPTQGGPYPQDPANAGDYPGDNAPDTPTPAPTAAMTSSSVGDTPGHGPDTPLTPASSSAKPAVGSSAWHAMRKSNHKEVERRRRETINEGINELAKIVPGCEKNKGAVLARAVQYITKLQEDANSNIDKWTFEKLVTDQAISDLSHKLHRAWDGSRFWRDEAQKAGADIDRLDEVRRQKEEEEEREREEEQAAQQAQQQHDNKDGADAVDLGVDDAHSGDGDK